jgi:hypothetical protein
MLFIPPKGIRIPLFIGIPFHICCLIECYQLCEFSKIPVASAIWKVSSTAAVSAAAIRLLASPALAEASESSPHSKDLSCYLKTKK